MIKTRVQTYDLMPVQQTACMQASSEAQPLLDQQSARNKRGQIARPSTFHIAREAYRIEGISTFFRGLGVCSARAFLVNAVQWAVSPACHSSWK